MKKKYRTEEEQKRINKSKKIGTAAQIGVDGVKVATKKKLRNDLATIAKRSKNKPVAVAAMTAAILAGDVVAGSAKGRLVSGAINHSKRKNVKKTKEKEQYEKDSKEFYEKEYKKSEEKKTPKILDPEYNYSNMYEKVNEEKKDK